jgi:hypothetical protein
VIVRYIRALRAMLAIAAAAFVLLGATAQAGTYDVIACTGAAGGVPKAFTAVADPGMAAYSICPNSPSNPASGIVTRASASAGPASVPYLAGAYQIFEAPPGASLVSVSFDVAAIRLASYWTTGIVAYDGDLNVGERSYGCYAGSSGCAIGTSSFFGPVTGSLNAHTKFRFETRCGNPGRCDISASGFQPGMRALFSAANVTVRVQDFSAPSIVPVSGALWSSGWQRGNEQAWETLTDNVGIMLLRLYVDGVLEEAQDFRDGGWPSHVRCDFTRSRPCNDIPRGGLSLDTRTLSDGQHRIRVEAVDAAGNAGALDRTITIDNTAPGPVSASVEGGERWRRTNDFSIRWSPPAEQASPIASAHYLLCQVGEAERCSTGGQSGHGIERLTSVKVPAPGEFGLRVWLEDEAGNASSANAGAAVSLRFDDVAPEAVFERLDERDPRRLSVLVSDRGAGVEGGAIEMRRAGSRQWHELDTWREGDRLYAYVDDISLPDGRYELRAIVRDRAGNEHLTAQREDGARMELTLPLRQPSRLTISTATRRAGCDRRRRHPGSLRCRRKHKSTREPVVRGGGTARGRLETAQGKPLAGASIELFEQSRAGGDRRRVGTLRSDELGRFSHSVGPGSSRTISFRFDGSPLIKPAQGQLTVLVPARTTLESSRRRLRNGRSVRFKGRLLGRPVPDGGKLIDLQVYYRRKWRTFATPRTDAGGGWRFDYRFEATRGLVTYRFRARIRREAAYPYELGYSRVVSVTVRGP